MGFVSGLATFFMIWWTMLFVTLPLGVQRHDGSVKGVDPGAPQNANMKKKFLLTTGLAIIVWLIVFALVESDLSFRDMANRMAL
jgi:predicted secreted protein